MAFVSVSKAELRQLARDNNKRAKLLLKLRASPERTLSIIQVGITLVGALAAAVGGAGAAETVEPYLMEIFGIKEIYAETLAVGIVVIPLTYFSVVLGELVPKSIALRYSRRIVIAGAGPLLMSDRLLWPVVSLLEHSTKLILKVFLSSDTKETPLPEEISAIDINKLSPAHQNFMVNMVNLEKTRMKDILEPWSKTVSLSSNASSSDVTRIIHLSAHTRLPVTDENNKVIGILHAKEFLTWQATGEELWSPLLRAPLFVKPQDLALHVLRLLQEKHAHMAIIIDEKQQPLGIITLEDILEEVVGEIFDEDDDGLIRKLYTSRSRTQRYLSRSKKS